MRMFGQDESWNLQIKLEDVKGFLSTGRKIHSKAAEVFAEIDLSESGPEGDLSLGALYSRSLSAGESSTGFRSLGGSTGFGGYGGFGGGFEEGFGGSSGLGSFGGFGDLSHVATPATRDDPRSQRPVGPLTERRHQQAPHQSPANVSRFPSLRGPSLGSQYPRSALGSCSTPSHPSQSYAPPAGATFSGQLHFESGSDALQALWGLATPGLTSQSIHMVEATVRAAANTLAREMLRLHTAPETQAAGAPPGVLPYHLTYNEDETHAYIIVPGSGLEEHVQTSERKAASAPKVAIQLTEDFESIPGAKATGQPGSTLDLTKCKSTAPIPLKHPVRCQVASQPRSSLAVSCSTSRRERAASQVSLPTLTPLLLEASADRAESNEHAEALRAHSVRKLQGRQRAARHLHVGSSIGGVVTRIRVCKLWRRPCGCCTR